MKDFMIDMMVAMMPIMKPFMWAGVAIAVIGLLLVTARIIFNSNTAKGITWTGRFVFAVAVFFISAQLAGFLLNMPPAINFGDSSKFEFILVNFWQISLGFFVIGILIKSLATIRPLKAI